jgi:imidazolonepropionase-like amidohydrolase
LGLTGPRDVLVVDEHILSVTPSGVATADVPEDVAVYDVTAMTIMPGMVAGHIHLSYFEVDISVATALEMAYPPTYIAVAATRSAARTLAAGFTSAVGAGGLYDIDMVLKQLMADGLATGPRLVASGRDLIATGHPLDNRPDWWQAGPGPLGVICDGPDEFRKAVRQEAKRGAEVIKLYPEGGHGFPKRASRLTYDEIATVVETAELCGMRVRAHVYSKPAILSCLKAGVQIIDHADHMDEEIIELFVKHGSFVLPSLYLLKAAVGLLNTKEECEAHYARARLMLAKGVEAGVTFVTGDDFGTQLMPHGTNGEELRCYVDDIGIAPREVLKWATTNGAAMMERNDLGEIAPGKLADLLIVNGDPESDIRCVADPNNILMVMQGGKVATERGLQPMTRQAH